MNIITISREFGSGGKELGKKIAEKLGYDFYDSQIISFLADAAQHDEAYVNQVLQNHEWNTIPIATNHSYTRYVLYSTQILIDEKNAIEKIAETGHDFVIVGKNADVFLEKYNPLRIFVCADMDKRVERCMKRALKEEHYNEKETMKMIKRIDKTRSQTRDLIGGSPWGSPSSYDISINTTNIETDKLADSIVGLAKEYFK